jgi:hypothetical protein
LPAAAGPPAPGERGPRQVPDPGRASTTSAAPETFTTAQAPAFAIWAAAEGPGEISIWALQRDNGNCPDALGAESCSGVAQPTWYFSRVFEPFSHLP